MTEADEDVPPREEPPRGMMDAAVIVGVAGAVGQGRAGRQLSEFFFFFFFGRHGG